MSQQTEQQQETQSQNQQTGKHARIGSRSYSRTLLQNDMDLIHKYAAKYVPSRQSIINNTSQYTSYKSKMATIEPSNFNYSVSPLSSVSNNSMTNLNNTNNGIVESSEMNVDDCNQDSVINNHLKGTKRRQQSNLIGSPNFQGISEDEINSMENEMSHAMNTMLNTYQGHVEQRAKFLDEMEEQASNNPNFCKMENADNWTVQEVCHWLTNVHLEKYVQPFSEQTIDGSILLRDLDEMILTSELGIKKIHVKKIMREIEKLRLLSPNIQKEKEESTNRDALITSLKMEIDSLQRENKHLREEMSRHKQNIQLLQQQQLLQNSQKVKNVDVSNYTNTITNTNGTKKNL